MCRVWIFFIISLFLLPQNLWASNVIFMINMNYSSDELNTLKKVAQDRNQELIVVPPEDGNQIASSFEKTKVRLEKKIKEIHPDWDSLQIYNAVLEIQKSHGTSNPELATEAADELSIFLASSAEVEKMENELGTIDEQIRKKFQEIHKNNKKIDSLVISAHSDGTNLSGETSYNLNGYEVFQLSKDFPEIFKSPRHVLLLGCYTMTKSNRKFWRGSIFPNATLITGFSPRAPSRIDPNNLRFITDVMTKANELDKKLLSQSTVLNKSEVENVFLSLKSITGTRYNPVIDYCTYQIEGNPKLQLNCEDEWNLLLDQAYSVQEIYLNLTNPQKDPPRDTSFSDLRKFYNDLQEVCSPDELKNIPEEERIARSDYVDSMIMMTRNLIFWWNVQTNFSFCKAQEITQLNSALAQIDIDQQIPALDGNTSWIDFVQRVNNIRSTTRTNLQKAKSARIKYISQDNQNMVNAANNEIDVLTKVRKQMEFLNPLYELNEELPLSWHNPGTSKTRCEGEQ